MAGRSILAVLLVVGCVASVGHAVTLPIANANFENPLLDETGSSHPVITSNNSVPSWNATNTANAYQAVYDPDVNRLEAAGVDNNWLYQGGSSAANTTNSSKQNLSTPLAIDTKYVLTVMTGYDTGAPYSYPAVGDGVTTGRVFARLLVDNSIGQDGSSLVAMPGLVSSVTPTPASHGSIVNWTLTWQTTDVEALSGKALWVELAMNGVSGVTDEVYWDNVAVVATVPEPGSIGALATLSMMLANRRSRRAR